jgi:O-antigen/teichoic acid export membrane protein
MGSVYLFIPFYIFILGIEAYGVIAFYSILLTFGSLADIGMSTTFSREAARETDPAKLIDLLATIERVLLAIATVLALVICVGARFIAEHWLNAGGALSIDQITTSIRLMAFAMVPQLGLSLYSAGLLGLQRQSTSNILQAAFATVRGGVVILGLYRFPSLEFFFAWQLASSLVAFAVARSLLLNAMGIPVRTLGHFAFRALRSVLGFAGGMMMLTLLAAINTQLDKLVVSKLFSIEEFGYYSLASTLAQLPVVAASPLMIAMFPRLTELAARGREGEASALFEQFSVIVAAISGVGAFGLVFFAGDVLPLWLGRAYTPSVVIDVVRTLAMGGLFLSIASTPFYLGLAHGHNRTSIITGAATLLLTVPLLLWAASTMGLGGVAVPWLILNALAFTAMVSIVVRRYYQGPVMGWLIRSTAWPVFAAGCMLAAARVLADSIGAGPLVACAIAGVAAATTAALLVMRPLRMLSAHAATESIHTARVAG